MTGNAKSSILVFLDFAQKICQNTPESSDGEMFVGSGGRGGGGGLLGSNGMLMRRGGGIVGRDIREG